MGGASGHLSHLVEDWDLTFDDLKDIVSMAAEARLENVTEKTDGINLVFTWNEDQGMVRIARNTTDIKTGGMASDDVKARFGARGQLEAVFLGAYDALRAALRAVPAKARIELFGPAGERWYSAEVMSATAPNTIRYAGDNIVFHEQPVFWSDKASGRVARDETMDGSELSRWIDVMRDGARGVPWTLHPRAVLELQRLTDGSVVAEALAKINAAMTEVQARDGDTIGTYVHRRVAGLLARDTSAAVLPPNVVAALAARIAGVSGAATLTAIKKMAPAHAEKLKELVDKEKQFIELALSPLERAMREFAVGLLKGVRSLFVSDPSEEAARLRSATAKALTALQRSHDPKARAMLAMMQDKLTQLDDISPIEGIVFMHRGRPYKLTGAFAPMNRVLGFFAYGSDKLSEATRRLHEGGRSFSVVGPVTLQALRGVWPRIERTFLQAGAKNIEAIGTTWKKDPMGDVDLAMEHDGGREGLYTALASTAPGMELRRVGSNIVSVAYPLPDGRAVQVDAMVGDVGYLTWSRYGPSPMRGHAEHSAVKGVVRNMLLNVVAAVVSGRAFPGRQTELDRERYIVDFDRGLFRVVQTKRPARRQDRTSPAGKPLADWRTLERVHVTSKPDEIVAVLLGPGHRASELRRFEDIARALRASRAFTKDLDAITAGLTAKLRDYVDERGPDILGQPLEQVEDLVRRELSSSA